MSARPVPANDAAVPDAPWVEPSTTESVMDLSAEQRRFLSGFIDPPPPLPLYQLPPDDRLFIGGIQKRWHARKLELPVLPATALELSDVLRSGNASLERYVELVQSDSALSVEVFKSANSALFARGAPVRHLHDAILRIGLRRLESVLIMAQLNAKIFKGGIAQGAAATLMDMVPALGYLASSLARTHGNADHLSFMRGTLLHVEHMVILGGIAEVARDHRHQIRPSMAALHQAFAQFGPEIRHALAVSWNMPDVLLYAPDVVHEFAGFRHAIIAGWLNEPLPALYGVEAAQLERVLSRAMQIAA